MNLKKLKNKCIFSSDCLFLLVIDKIIATNFDSNELENFSRKTLTAILHIFKFMTLHHASWIESSLSPDLPSTTQLLAFLLIKSQVVREAKAKF